jgi:4-hydroxythreonine-4-phosphate dehydrogenase
MDSNNSEKNGSSLPVIGITIGDINGIGPEVIMKTLSDNRIANQMIPVIYGSTKTLSYYRKSLDLNDFNYSQSKDASNLFPKKINVLNCWEEVIEIKVGESTNEAGTCSRLALERASKDLEEKYIDAIVTGPINKQNVHSEEFNFAGHTEFLAQRFGQGDSLMMMVSNNLKVAMVTGHIPLSEVSKSITTELFKKKLSMLESSLINDFGITKPKIAILGLNPHSGEEGLLGKEETEIIIPIIKELKHKGKLIFGPYPSDGFFGTAQYQKYDAILAMYHDQGLIPFKSLSFDTGVNFTAGIGAVRTSPDHGTAYSIAGKNIASEKSMREALFLAYDIVKPRKSTE